MAIKGGATSFVRHVVGKAASGRIDTSKVDATTEEAIRRQVAEDEAAAMQDVAAYVRRIRIRIGMTQRCTPTIFP
jgi:hypothetical protein